MRLEKRAVKKAFESVVMLAKCLWKVWRGGRGFVRERRFAGGGPGSSKQGFGVWKKGFGGGFCFVGIEL